MTPVQLPEVPAHSYGFDPNQRESEDAFRWRVTPSHPESLYTTAQLREYATEAVMAERAESEKLRTALSDLMSWFEEKPIHEWRLQAGRLGADDAVAAARELLTPSETNSD